MKTIYLNNDRILLVARKAKGKTQIIQEILKAVDSENIYLDCLYSLRDLFKEPS